MITARSRFAVGVIACLLTRLCAAESKSQDPLHRDTPQSAISSFLKACDSRNYQAARRYLDLRHLPDDQRLKGGPQLAQQLEQILDHDTRFDVASLSKDPEGVRERLDTFTVNGRPVELQLERTTLRSGLSVWLVSPDSVALIPQLARLTSDSPIEKYLPEPLVSWKIMDTSLWRWIAMALLAALLVAFSRMLAWLAFFLMEMLLKRVAPKVNRDGLHVFVGPLRLLLTMAFFRAGMEWAGPSAALRLYLERGLTLFFYLGLAWLAMGIVDLSLGRLRTVLEGRRQTFAHSVMPLASRVFKLTILLLAIAAVLSSWGYNTSTILAGLGVGGLAIALAAQKTIENLFGGVSVISDRPVFVGDVCKFGDQMGTVEDIGLRSTRIRTPDRTLVTVPNAQFSSMTLENFSRRDKMLFHFKLNLRRDTRPDQVRALLKSITQVLADHTKVESGPVPVRFIGVGTYSLDVEVFAYIQTRDGDEFLQIQEGLFLRVLDAVEEAGTALALPTQASIDYSHARQEVGAGGRS
jgi:MscS family membrane protein